MSSDTLVTTKNLLCVDDEQNILLSLQRLFLAEEYTVFLAHSGQEGLELLEKQAIDIIVSDMRMPHMDGAAFLKIVAERWPETKRVLMTGFADLASVMLAINEGKIDYYLTKPWNNEQVITAVANLLRQKWLADENRALQSLLSHKNEELSTLNNKLEEKVEQRTYELHKSYQELEATHQAAVQVLLSVQELHERRCKGYCRNVATHAKLLAEALNCSAKEIEVVYLGAMLHNLGKSGLSEELMFKPFMKLNRQEHNEYIQYPFLGAAALSGFPALKEVANAILHHREYYDGMGYPDKLIGEAIPLASRILSLAVDFNELQHGMLIPGECHAKLALRYLIEHAHHYDPKLLPTFVHTIRELPDEESALNERACEPFSLRPGMVLSRDLVSKNGFVYLFKGHILTAEIIGKINVLERQIVYVYQQTPK